MTISIRKDWKTSKAHYHSITYVQSAYSWLMSRKSNICKKNSITSKNCPLTNLTSCAMPSLPQTFATSSSHPYSSRYADLLPLLHSIASHFKTDSLHLHKRFIDSLLQSTCSSSLLPEHLVCNTLLYSFQILFLHPWHFFVSYRAGAIHLFLSWYYYQQRIKYGHEVSLCMLLDWICDLLSDSVQFLL